MMAAKVFLEGVATLLDMGYDYTQCTNAMAAAKNDVTQAVSSLLDQAV